MLGPSDNSHRQVRRARPRLLLQVSAGLRDEPRPHVRVGTPADLVPQGTPPTCGTLRPKNAKLKPRGCVTAPIEGRALNQQRVQPRRTLQQVLLGSLNSAGLPRELGKGAEIEFDRAPRR